MYQGGPLKTYGILYGLTNRQLGTILDEVGVVPMPTHSDMLQQLLIVLFGSRHVQTPHSPALPVDK